MDIWINFPRFYCCPIPRVGMGILEHSRVSRSSWLSPPRPWNMLLPNQLGHSPMFKPHFFAFVLLRICHVLFDANSGGVYGEWVSMYVNTFRHVAQWPIGTCANLDKRLCPQLIRPSSPPPPLLSQPFCDNAAVMERSGSQKKLSCHKQQPQTIFSIA